MIRNASNENESESLSVVIATLGGDSLKQTIQHLNTGSIVPDEILICIPATLAHRVSGYSFPNTKVITTDCKGQVAQRAIGFMNASNNYVMQLDDDLLVDRYCIENLLGVLKGHGSKAAVAPSLFWVSTRESFYKPPGNKLLLKWYYWLLNGGSGYEPGTITRAGTNVGIDPSTADKDIFDVDWVAGGCVMHRKENLILENFYPYTGKAYCEDIIHSHHLKTRGLQLFVSSKAICWLECPPMWSHSWSAFVRDLVMDFKARRYFVRLTSRSAWRMALYYFVSLLRYAYVKLFRWPV